MINLPKVVTFEEAKREFEIRCYYWLGSEFEREVNASFPNLRLFRSGLGWKIHQLMQQLEGSDQLILARAILKRWYSADLGKLGERVSEEERILLDAFDPFASGPSGIEVEIRTREQAGEKIKMATK